MGTVKNCCQKMRVLLLLAFLAVSAVVGVPAVVSAHHPLVKSTQCEGTICPGGCCPDAGWFCCPDNINCAPTGQDCPGVCEDYEQSCPLGCCPNQDFGCCPEGSANICGPSPEF